MTPTGMRRALVWLFLFGTLGTGAELMLLEHTEDLWQLIPLMLMALAVGVLTWHAAAGSRWSFRVFQGLMWLFVTSGIVGVYLHYRGNVEFELEMYPSLSGLSLFWEAMQGATPALAPGAMTGLGLLGLVYAFRHPAAIGISPGLPPDNQESVDASNP